MPLSGCSLGSLYFTTRSLHTLASDRNNRNAEIRLIRVLFKLPEDQGWHDLDGWPGESAVARWDRVRWRNVCGSCIYGIGLEISRASNCYKYCINARFIKWRHLTARTAILVSHKRSSPSSNAQLFARWQKTRVHSETSVVVYVRCVEFRGFGRRTVPNWANSARRFEAFSPRVRFDEERKRWNFRACHPKGSREEEESRFQSEIQRRIATLMSNGTRTTRVNSSFSIAHPKRYFHRVCQKIESEANAFRESFAALPSRRNHHSQREPKRKPKEAKKKKKGRREKQCSNRGSERSITFNPCNDDNRSIS